MEKEKAMALRFGRTAANTSASGRMTRHLEEEDSFTVMEMCTKGIGEMTQLMEKAYTCIIAAQPIKDPGSATVKLEVE